VHKLTADGDALGGRGPCDNMGTFKLQQISVLSAAAGETAIAADNSRDRAARGPRLLLRRRAPPLLPTACMLSPHTSHLTPHTSHLTFIIHVSAAHRMHAPLLFTPHTSPCTGPGLEIPGVLMAASAIA